MIVGAIAIGYLMFYAVYLFCFCRKKNKRLQFVEQPHYNPIQDPLVEVRV